MEARNMSRWFIVLGFLAGAILAGCSTKTIRNADLWYTLSVPADWQIEEGRLSSPQKDALKVVRLRDDSPLEQLVQSTRRSIQIEMPGYVMETEDFIKVNGKNAWRIIGTFKPTKNSADVTMIKVIVDAGQYKYILDFTTLSENYNQRKEPLQQIIDSFSYKIPEY